MGFGLGVIVALMVVFFCCCAWLLGFFKTCGLLEFCGEILFFVVCCGRVLGLMGYCLFVGLGYRL